MSFYDKQAMSLGDDERWEPDNVLMHSFFKDNDLLRAFYGIMCIYKDRTRSYGFIESKTYKSEFEVNSKKFYKEMTDLFSKPSHYNKRPIEYYLIYYRINPIKIGTYYSKKDRIFLSIIKAIKGTYNGDKITEENKGENITGFKANYTHDDLLKDNEYGTKYYWLKMLFEELKGNEASSSSASRPPPLMPNLPPPLISNLPPLIRDNDSTSTEGGRLRRIRRIRRKGLYRFRNVR
jgi:hypothetical protein